MRQACRRKQRGKPRGSSHRARIFRRDSPPSSGRDLARRPILHCDDRAERSRAPSSRPYATRTFHAGGSCLACRRRGCRTACLVGHEKHSSLPRGPRAGATHAVLTDKHGYAEEGPACLMTPPMRTPSCLLNDINVVSFRMLHRTQESRRLRAEPRMSIRTQTATKTPG